MRCRGFTLTEVLVALCLLAIGVLGATASHATALRTAQAARLRAQALLLGGALAEQMQANAAVFRVAGAANPYLSFDFAAADGAPALASCDGMDCDPVARARADLGAAAQRLTEAFPAGRLVTCRDAAATVAWACSGAGPLRIKIGWGGPSAPGTGPAVVLAVAEPLA